MEYILITFASLVMTLQSVFQKQYNIKSKAPNVFLYSSMLSFFAMLFFLACSKLSLSFTIKLLPYSIAFAFSYALTWFGSVYAIRTGSMALTSLITSYSLIIPAAYGLIFLNESLKILGISGIILLFISILLLKAKGGYIKITPKWVLFVSLTFIGNGMCSTIQKMQQLSFGGGYKNEFMIISLFISTIILFIPALTSKIHYTDFKACACYGFLSGIANGSLNLLVMILAGMISNAILFPSLSAGGIIFSFIISIFIYKEHLTKSQIVGYIIGMISIILLNV